MHRYMYGIVRKYVRSYKYIYILEIGRTSENHETWEYWMIGLVPVPSGIFRFHCTYKIHVCSILMLLGIDMIF